MDKLTLINMQFFKTSKKENCHPTNVVSEETQSFSHEELDQTKLIRSLKGCDTDSTLRLGNGL